MSPKWYDFAAQRAQEGEELLKNYSGRLDGNYGHLFITNQRLFFVKEEGFLRKSYEQTMSLPLTNLDELLKEANKTVSGMTAQKENLPDPSDRASLESDRNFTLRIRDRERKLIGKINAALERIDTGTYGICEECGEDISEARLKARPVTTLCIDCKKKQEMDEKARGL